LPKAQRLAAPKRDDDLIRFPRWRSGDTAEGLRGTSVRLTDWIVLHSSVCDNPLRAMRLLHDRLYGQGTGRTFLRGDYLADLPRAVRERIRVEVARRGLESPEVRGTYPNHPTLAVRIGTSRSC
jgi:hypothetical protein